MSEWLEGWPPPVLDPAGPYAWSISLLAWGLIAMAVAVLAIVLVVLWAALFGKKKRRAQLGGTKLVWIGGIAFPVVVLTVLLVIGLTMIRNLTPPITGNEMRVRVTGEMWWWRVAYLDGQGKAVSLDANELHIPTGRPVLIELQSSDVIHSFWVPRLSGKVDMIPGRTNLMRIEADRPGVYGGQCAEYCGGPHALMGFMVIAHEPAAFEELMRSRNNPVRAERSRGAPAQTPLDPGLSRATAAGGGRGARDERNLVARGESLFASTGCAACHRIAGTSANGLAGPDLTHVGSRRMLGAGILPNNRGTMMGWIGDSQAIKPGNRMPPYRVLTAEQLTGLAAYLETLK